jgi:uncharacterized protein (DUF305 family)
VRRLGAAAAALALAASLLVSGCSDDVDSTSESTIPANDSELRYLDQMFAHHTQGVQLGLHAASEGDDDDVRAIAQQIAVSQAREQGEIQALLADRRRSVGSAGSHPQMAGMIASEDMADTRALDGRALDRGFVDLMIEHHQGAVTATNDLLATVELTPQVRDLASRISTGQEREITELQLLSG